MKETLIRILGLYKKEDRPKYDQLRRIEMAYEAKRVQLIKKYEAVNSAKQVNLAEIPLPFCPEENSTKNELSNNNQDKLASSSDAEQQQKYITITGEIRNDLKPPGCPALNPPSLEELENEIKSFGKDLESLEAEKDLDEFLKEIDQVEKQASITKETVQPQSTLIKVSNATNNLILPVNIPPPMLKAAVNNLSKPHLISSTLPNQINPTPFLINPMNHHLLNPPPPLKRPNASFKSTQLNKFNLTRNQMQPMLTPTPTATKKEFTTEKVTSATIEAKPQLRNLSADITKFLPTSLRIKRQNNTRKVIKPNALRRPIISTTSKPIDNQSNKDEAYAEFMKELNGLI